MFLIYLFFISFFPIEFLKANGAQSLNSLKEKSEVSEKKINQKANLQSFKEQEELLKQIILQDSISARALSDADIKPIENILDKKIKDYLIKGFKFKVQDDRLKANGSLHHLLTEESISYLLKKYKFKSQIIKKMKKNNKKLYGHTQSYINYINPSDGEFEIVFYQIQDKKLLPIQNLVLEKAPNCRVLDDLDIQKLKLNPDIQDRKYISNACEIIIQDDRLKANGSLRHLFNQEVIKFHFNLHFKEEVTDIIQIESLDKFLSVYIKILNPNEGKFKVIFANTKTQKEPVLRRLLSSIKNVSLFSWADHQQLEEIYEIRQDNKYIIFGFSFLKEYNKLSDFEDFLKEKSIHQFQKGGAFSNSFALMDHILENPKYRYLRNEIIYMTDRFFKQANLFKDEDNIFIRTRLTNKKGAKDNLKALVIDVFTLSDSPLKAIQRSILDNCFNVNFSRNKILDKKILDKNDIQKEIPPSKQFKYALKVNISDPRFRSPDGHLKDFINKNQLDPLFKHLNFKKEIIQTLNKNIKDHSTESEFFQFNLKNIENIHIYSKIINSENTNDFDMIIYELIEKSENIEALSDNN